MKTVNARISSKNQLTLPAKLVRKYGLDTNRNVTIAEKNGSLVITPAKSLQEIMQPFWDEFARTHPNLPKLSDKDIHEESRRAFDGYYQES